MRLFNTKEKSQDVKSVRDALLYFIRQQLSAVEGGEGRHIKGLHLYFNCDASERPVYEAAVYYGEEGRFKEEEIQRIADDYAIELPAGWTLDMEFTDSLPSEAIKIPELAGALWISTTTKSAPATATATITVLNGEAEEKKYIFHAGMDKINIGRDKNVQLKDGFMRFNQICFPASSSHEANKFISRQHAHIQYDAVSGQFLLFADEGGVPPHNKIKVKRSNETVAVKLQSIQVPHLLRDGDQIMLGESALLEFKTTD